MLCEPEQESQEQPGCLSPSIATVEALCAWGWTALIICYAGMTER